MKAVIIGIGNENRSDDAVGVRIARHLGKRGLPETTVGLADDTASLLDLMRDADAVVLFDAVQSGAAAGTVFRFDPRTDPIPSRSFRRSTHDLGVAEALLLAEALGQLPRHCVLYGIEGKNFKHGTRLSYEVRTSAKEVEDLALHELMGILPH